MILSRTYFLAGVWLLLCLGLSAQDYYKKIYAFPSPKSKTVGAKLGDLNVAAYDFETDAGSMGIQLTAMDACGDISWSKHLTTSVQITRLIGIKTFDSKIYICATLAEHTFHTQNIMIACIDRNGNLEWARQYGQRFGYYWYTFDINEQGNFYINSNVHSDSLSGHSNVILKINHDQSIAWAKAYMFSPIYGFACATSDGGILNTSGNRVFKIASDGAVQWTYWYRFAPLTGTMLPLEVEDGYLIPGARSSGPVQTQINKLDKAGNHLWSSPLISGFVGQDIAMIQGRIRICGNTAEADSGLGIITLDDDGSILKQWAYPDSNYPHLRPTFIDDKDEITVVAGWSNSQMYGGFSLSKFATNGDSIMGCADSLVSHLLVSETYPPKQPSVFPVTDLDFTSQPLNLQVQDVSPFPTDSCESYPPLNFSLPADTTICPGTILILGAPDFRYDDLLWSTGESTNSIRVSDSGTYWLEAQISCDNRIYRDTIKVDFLEQQEISANVSPDRALTFEHIHFSAEEVEGVDYQWEFGDGETSNEPVAGHEYTRPGTYEATLIATGSNGCRSSYSFDIAIEPHEVKAPNVFTPNEDGINDNFRLISPDVVHYQMRIFNRYGTLIYESENKAWNGKTNLGADAAEGTYFYIISYRVHEAKEKTLSGHLSLFR